MPATVVAAQVKSGELPDPYVGMNLRKFPGMTYPIGLNSFNNVAMDPGSPYACAWWYRTQFNLPRSYLGRTVGTFEIVPKHDYPDTVRLVRQILHADSKIPAP